MSEVEIGPPRPGDLGWLIGLHGRWYAANKGFSLQFEWTVARIVADVAPRLAPPLVTMLVARDGDGPLATLTADGEDVDEAGRGHIRIVIAEPRAQGRGLGHRLLAMGLANLRAASLPGAYLDTFARLDAARAVYEKAGFRLVREEMGGTWGTPVAEQRFELDF
ncbi:MAG: GNAT family N-acetyltransferase [Pseudomonadota bacterium]